MKKYRIMRQAVFLLLIIVFAFCMPQKTFAEDSAKIERPTGDLKPQEAELYDNEISTYEVRGADYSESDYELYSILEERVKAAMLEGKTVVDISDLNLKKGAYDVGYFYGYSPYFPNKSGCIKVWYTSTGYYVQLTIDNIYGSVDETKQVFQAIDQKLAYVYELVDNSMTDEQKAITVHDYLVSHAKYDYSFSNYTSYGVLMGGTGVCQSYALAYMYIMNHLGVETHFLPSDSMNHAWNVIQIDGEYYNVDCTFDDPTWNGSDRYGAAEHSYFLRSTQEMKTLEHTFDTEPYECISTKYSNSYWRNVDSPVYFKDGMAYYTENGSVYCYSLADGGKQKISQSSSGIGVTLARNGDFLYYADTQKIYVYSIKSASEKVLYDASAQNEKIKGVIVEGSTLSYQGYSSADSQVYVKNIELQDEEGISGICGTDVKWTLDLEGILTISGTGDMTNYTYRSEMPWYEYISQIHTVKIESGVTSIGDYAFYGMKALKQIEIPEGVKVIGAYAFKNCPLLEQAELPSTLIRLGDSAFYGCGSLSRIEIPEGMYTIWSYTFKNCTSLHEVSFPSTLIKLDEAAFYGCASLEELNIPDHVAIIGTYCFKNCVKLTKLHLPEALTGIREAAFYGTALTEAAIPEKVDTIGKYAFKNCTALKDIQMSEKLKKIDESAFYGCKSLTSLILPDSISELGSYAFKNCTNVASVSLPSTLKVIGESGFYGCDHMISIEMPASVNTIGDYAFSRCTGLNTVIFRGDAPSIGAYTFAKVKADVYYPGDNETWSKDKFMNYGGTLTWKNEV